MERGARKGDTSLWPVLESRTYLVHVGKQQSISGLVEMTYHTCILIFYCLLKVGTLDLALGALLYCIFFGTQVTKGMSIILL